MCLCGYPFFSFQKSVPYIPKFLNHLANLVHIDQRKNTLPKKNQVTLCAYVVTPFFPSGS